MSLPFDDAPVLTQFQELARDNTSGATELIHRLVAICESCAIVRDVHELHEGFALLEQSQKSMPSLHAVLQILKTEFLPRLHSEDECADALGYLASLQTILEESGDRIAEQFAVLIDTPATVLTLSRSATVLTALGRLADESLLLHLRVLESRPMLEGVRTIRDLAARGVPATLYADAAFMEAMLGARCIVTGADCVSADGYVLNKIGTHPLAVCARDRGVPLYVLCDSLKFSPLLREAIDVEDAPAEELHPAAAAERFTVWNRYFEWLPVDLVTAFVTERGVFAPDQLTGLATE